MGMLDWLVIALAAAIAGVFNLSVALRQFQAISKGLIFFDPLRSIGFWVWVSVQMLIPAIAFLFWVTEFFAAKPPLEFMLFVQAVGVGVGFTAFLNARTETGFLTINIQSIYESLSRLGFDLIARKETYRTSQFWRDLETELRQPYITLNEGLRDLSAYFSSDISLNLPERVDEKGEFLSSIHQALRSTEVDTKIDTARILLPEVRQRDVVNLLKGFQCSPEFLKRHVPPRFHAQPQSIQKAD